MEPQEGLTSSPLEFARAAGSLTWKMNPNCATKLPKPMFGPEVEVLAALNDGDDERIWRQLQHAADEDELLRVVADEAPRMLYRTRRGPYFTELLLVPVVEEVPGSVIGNDLTWKNAEQCFATAVSDWLGHTGDHVVFRGIRPYEWIATWGPSALRQHLLAAVPGARHGSLTFHPPELTIPNRAPRLGFAIISVRSQTSWPELPEPNTLRDARFRGVVSNALAYSGNVEVLPPDQLPAALADGLCLWIAELHKTIRIEEWDFAPCTTAQDAVRVRLGFEKSSLALTVRRHQIAPVGIHCVAAVLAAIAPQPKHGLTQ